MMLLPSPRHAASLLLILLGALALFHLLVAVGVLPGDLVWGGRLEGSEGDVLAMELVSLAVTLMLMLLVALRAGHIRAGRLRLLARVGMWVMCLYFVVNILANLTSASSSEKMIFTPLSIVLALLALRVAVAGRGEADRGHGALP